MKRLPLPSDSPRLHGDVLRSVLALTDRSTLATCLRVSRLFFQIAGSLIYCELPFGDLVGVFTTTQNNTYSTSKLDLLACTRILNVRSHRGSCRHLPDLRCVLPNLDTVRLSDDSPWYTYCYLGCDISSSSPTWTPVLPWSCPLLQQLQPSTLVLQDTLPPTSRAPAGFGGAFLQSSIRRIVITLRYGCFWIRGADGTRMLDRLGPSVEEVVLVFGRWESGWKASSSWRNDWPGSPCVASQLACIALEGPWRLTVVGSEQLDPAWTGDMTAAGAEAVVRDKIEVVWAKSILAKEKRNQDCWVPVLPHLASSKIVQERLEFIKLGDWLARHGRRTLPEEQVRCWSRVKDEL